MKTKLAGLCLLVTAFLTGNVTSADLDLGSPTARTPYDSYLDPMWKVFRQLGENQPDRALVDSLVRQGRSFRYAFKQDQPYVPQSPEQTDLTKCGDCKAKSLWLASKMNSRKLRFVIGKFHLGDSLSHAWLIWEGPEGWLVLDATNFSKPLVPDRLSPSELVPAFSFSPAGKFAHTVSAAARGSKYADHL